MKSLILTFSLLFSITLSVIAGRVEQIYHSGNPTVRLAGDYQVFELGKATLTALPGQPVLPYMQVSLMLPPGESAVDMEIVFSDEIILAEKLNIFPQQGVRPLSSESSGIFIKDNEVYKRNSPFPYDPKGQLITAFLGGYSFALTTFTPVRYNPVTGKLSYYETARVIIHTEPDVRSAKALDNKISRNKQVLKLADNKQMAQAYSVKRYAPSLRYELLIISTQEFKDSFTGLQANYLKQGIASELVTLDSIIETMPGVDIPEKIRNFIIQEYQLHEIQYVLLAGDDELIPHRGLYCYVESGSGYTDNNIPSDLYFSALDGNWNTDGDDLWGEPGEDDLLPEVAVGRMPFSNTSELEHMLNKSYKYQFTPVAGEFRNILMAGEHLWADPETWGSDYLKMLKGGHSENGYTTKGIPEEYPFDEMYDETAAWTGQDLMNRLNLGRPMLNHVGHSNETFAMKMSNSDITNDNFASLNGIDHNFSIVYTHGCLCGAFDYNDCIAEKMVSIDNFAAAFIGNSRYGWFNEGQTEGPSLHLHREFIDALYADSLNRIGRAHMESKIASAAWVTAPGQWEPGALRWCFYGCNVLGDPTLAVFTDNPIVINTVFPSIVAFGATSITVNVNASGLPAAGLMCVAMKDGIIIGKSVTDESGNSVIIFDIMVQDPGEAQLIVSGYNCTPVTYNFEIVDYTGVVDVSGKKSNMTISPNPAAEIITVDAILNSKCDYILSVYNNEGKAILTNTKYTTESNGQINRSLNISDLNPGHYTCEIKSDKQRISKQFIVY